MKIINPHFVAPASTWAAANKDAINTWLQAPARAAMREITFDFIRANVAAAAGRTDGELAEVFRALGIQVQRA